MNKTIKLLMLSDIFFTTGFGLIEPVMAIFIKDNIVGGSIFTAGIASTVFIVTKCAVQLPFSRYVDNHKDKVKWLITGSFIVSIVPFLYIIAEHIATIYLAQVLFGIGAGLAYPTWLGLWSTHLDKKHESFEWSLYSTLVGIGAATTATIGAAIAQFIGFTYTSIFVGLLSLIGWSILFGLEKKRHKKAGPTIHLHHHKKSKLTHQRKYYC